MGCLRKLGCLVLLLAALVAGFLLRDRLGALLRRVRGTPEPAPLVYVTPAPGAAARADAALGALARRGGPAYVDVTAAELASLIERQLAGGGRRVLDSVAVALGDQRVEVRGSLDMSAVPHRLLGSLSEGLGRRERVVAGGLLSARPDGHLVWTIDQLKIGEFLFPRSVIPAILHVMNLTGADTPAVPIPLPASIGDVRVSPAGIRVYRASPR